MFADAAAVGGGGGGGGGGSGGGKGEEEATVINDRWSASSPIESQSITVSHSPAFVFLRPKFAGRGTFL